MAGPYYTDQEQLADAPQIDVSIPKVTDIGGKISDIGKTFATAAEPTLKDRAEKKAIEDAGAASIVRTPEGGYVRSNVTHGGGLIYSGIYDDALDQRQIGMMEQDYQTELDAEARKRVDDPDPANHDPKGYFAFASGRATAMLQNAPASVRAELDVRLGRAMAQSVRGYGEAVYTADRRRTMGDLQEVVRSKLGEMGKLARSNGDPVEVGKQMLTVRGEAQAAFIKLQALGAIGDADTFMQGFDADTFDERSLVTSTQSLQGLGASLETMSDEELRRLGYWGRGITDGGSIGGPAAIALPSDGLKTPGNIDIHNRSVAHNPDGSISTVRTISVGTDQGEVLIPTVIDGKVVSNEAAIAHFKATGENLGVFDTPAHADAYAQALHKQQAQEYGGAPRGMDFATFRELFPSREIAAVAGATANEVLNSRIAAANQKALMESMNQPKPVTVADVEANSANLNFAPDSGLTHEQFAAAQQQYDVGGPVAQQLRTPEGMNRTLGFLAATGKAHPATNDALRSMIYANDPDLPQAAFNFIWNAKGITTKGAWTGLKWFNTLPDDVKALANLDATLRRAGVNPTMELQAIRDNRDHRDLKLFDVVGEFGRQQDYDAAAGKIIGDTFGVKPADLGAALPKLREDFDRLLPINRKLYATKEQAMQATAAMLTTAWHRNDAFVDGIGDARLVAEGVPTWFLDKALSHFPELRSGNPAGATFSNGRVKIQSFGDQPGQMLPYYEFIFLNDHGQRLGRSAVFPMQRIVNGWHIYQQQLSADAARQAREDSPPDRWKLVREGGKVFYKDNSAEYAAWADAKNRKTNMRQRKVENAMPVTSIAPMHGRDY